MYVWLLASIALITGTLGIWMIWRKKPVDDQPDTVSDKAVASTSLVAFLVTALVSAVLLSVE